jgi:glutamyl-tRNA synthetase
VQQLAEEAMLFYIVELKPPPLVLEEEARKALRTLKARLLSIPWERAAINDAIKEVVKSNGLKMPQVAMPLRQIVTGRSHTPSIDGVLELLGREMVTTRLAQYLETD